MKSSIQKAFLVFCLIIGMQQRTTASISIDSVKTSISTCTNNGSAIVFAKSTPVSTLLYAIVAGPVITPLQNNNTFSSLFPGNYTARVYDINFDSAETHFTISGNYELPDFNLIGHNPVCAGSADGSIDIVPDSTTGLQPYLYSMISPNSLPLQSQNYFSSLYASTYQIRLTDACGNYQTRTSVLSNTGSGLSSTQLLVPYLVKIGCDTMSITLGFYLYKEQANVPLKLTLNTSTGSTVKHLVPFVIDTVNNTPGYFQLIDTIPNITYGDYLQAIITDTCGVAIYSYFNNVPPFDFDFFFQASQINCIASFSATLLLKQFPFYPYHTGSPMYPMSFTLTDPTTNTIVDSISGVPLYMMYIKPETPGHTYQIHVTDGCGQVWDQSVTWPSVGTPTVQLSFNGGCIDSTASVGFVGTNFQSTITVTILSGPANAGSTKYRYAYSDSITYPKSFMGLYFPSNMTIKDFPVGTYDYIVTDSCGNSVPGTFVIEPYMVSDLKYEWHIKPSCLNNNTMFYNFIIGTPIAVWASVTDIATNTIVAVPPLNYLEDSVTTLPIGNYALDIYYAVHNGNGAGYDGSIIKLGNDCWVLHDTINITPYTNNTFITYTTINCNGTNYVELFVDSSRGVAPYRFAIINGPQTFPLQDSTIFQINNFGNYVISMEDICGNNYTQQISINSDSFPPISKNGLLCAGQNVILSAVSSSHFTYHWQYPNGTIYTGDSISFHPFTVQDTGYYTITKIISINGCSDSLTSQYHLTLNDSIPQSFSICPGDSVIVGTHVYLLPGIYHDTLSTTSGCDSILITTLSYTLPVYVNNPITICNGDSVVVGIHSYLSTGIYADTVTIAGGCKNILITNLTVLSVFDSLFSVICQGDSIQFHNHFYNIAGIYNDTLISSAGCDSIVVFSLSYASPTFISDSANICLGDSIVLGNHTYFLPGTYIDTVSFGGGCLIIVTTQLKVNSIIDSVSALICQGDSILIGNNIYTLPGIYNDTLTSFSGCDSIIITTIAFSNLVIDTNRLNICSGDSVVVGNNTYYLPGTYMDTISVTGGCKKIIVTQISTHQITDSVNAVICQGDSIQIGNNTYSIPGVYKDTLVSYAGCDSIIIATIAFSNLIIDSNQVSICNGDSVIVGTNVYYLPGTYMDTVSVTGSCKKIIVTQLLTHQIIDSVSMVICLGTSISIGNSVYSLPGIYKDTLISLAGCDSIVILTLGNTLPAVSNTSLSICEGDSVNFRNQYYFHSGVFTDTIPTANCDSITILTLTVEPIPVISITANSDSIEPGGAIQLTCSNSQLSNYLWSGAVFSNANAATTNMTTVIPTKIYLTVTNSNGCVGLDSIFIFLKQNDGDSCEDAILYIPNTFTPNEDGINDLFKITATNIMVNSILIYNRWGQKIFESGTIETAWDGSFRNQKCTEGVYYYLLQYESCIDKKRKYKYGSITLLN